SNGCNYCHTQYVRESDTAMGPVSEAGNYVYDQPLIFGSERTGPDLSYLGRKRSEAWEVAHLKDPRQFSPMSIMPSYDFLPEEDLRSIVVYLFALGDRVAAENMITPPVAYAGKTDPLAEPLITPAVAPPAPVAATAAAAPPAAAPTPPPQGWDAWNAAQLQAGKVIYVEHCLTCHGAAGNGLGSYGGTLIVTPANFKQEPFRSMPDDQWFWHVSEGVPGTVMPPWKDALSVDERWQVIRYVQAVFSQPIMRDPDEGDPVGDYAGLTNPVQLTQQAVDEGKVIFTRECSVCHGSSGTGDGIYADGLQPPPPDFSDGSYGTLAVPSYTDADYFWRISEGLPWSAMPAWKTEYSEEDRWKLVHYIRSTFTQTEKMPEATAAAETPDIYRSQQMPKSISFDGGKQVYLQRCAGCHGMAGDGAGDSGAYLAKHPTRFAAMATTPPGQDRDADMFAKVTLGVSGSAMPVWGEILSVQDRWNVISYIQGAFIDGVPLKAASGDATAVPADVLTLSQSNWTDSGGVISADLGKAVYATNCADCHGAAGKGDGAGLRGAASAEPPAFEPDLSFSQIFSAVRSGVPGGIMPAYKQDLSDADLWNLSAFVETLANPAGGAIK
ncbi:MAG: c-type cytochrome, partial [Cypionkella sp.]